MNRILIICALFCFTCTANAQKDTCRVGLYINNIYDFKLDEKSFMADFWCWVVYKNDSLNFENSLEIPQSKSAEFSHYSIEKKGNYNWSTQQCKAEVIHDWNVSDFPFDEQRIRIQFEDSYHDTNSVVYIADTVNSKINKLFNHKEWHIQGFRVRDEAYVYETTYGNPELTGNSVYPRIIAEIILKRNCSWVLLTKMLTGAYVAFLISCLVFFISPDKPDSRFGLCVGGLFAAIGNKYIVESMVPTTTTNTLMDNVHNLTFSFILLIVLITIITLRLFDSGNENKIRLAKKIDRLSFYSIILLFVLLNTLLIYFATR